MSYLFAIIIVFKHVQYMYNDMAHFSQEINGYQHFVFSCMYPKGPAGRVGEELWLQAGGRGLRRREEVLGRCLVGRWEGAVMEMELDSFKNWGNAAGTLGKELR